MTEPSELLPSNGHGSLTSRRPIRGGVPASWAILCSAVVLSVIQFLPLPSAVRETVVLGFVLTVPGWSIARLLRVDRVDLELTVSMALAVSLVILVALVMVDAHLWHPYGAYDLALAVAGAAGLLQIAQS